MTKAITGGSFDPITYGHKDVIERAAKHFDKLTVGIGVNADKEGKYLFSLQERLYLVREAIKDILNIDVVAYRGMTTDYARENEYNVLVRGLRNGKDFDAEQSLERAFKRQQTQGLDTFFLNAKQSMQDLSSSVVKAILKEQGDIRQYVPMIVKQAMEGRLLGQYIAGITGSVCSGKSFTTEQFIKLCEKNGIPSHHLDLDKIGHEIQGPLQEPIYQSTRQKIIQTFGDDVANEDGSINRKILGPKVFSDPKKLEELNAIMCDPMNVRTKRLMYNQKGLFLYNAALIAEAGTTSKLNNNIVLVNVSPEIQAKRLFQRLEKNGFSPENISQIVSSQISNQFTTEQKRDTLANEIKKNKHGEIIELQSPYDEQDLEIAFNKILAQIDTFGELRFAGLLNRVGVKEDAKKVFTELRNIYDRPIASAACRDEIAKKIQGNYHKRLHIRDCLNELYQVKHLLKNPDAVECALLFHDVVYDPTSKTNEEDSAVFAEKILIQRGLPKEFIERVKQLILATKHTKPSTDNDSKYIMDIDMSIFGKELRQHQQYVKDVRREYYMYSDQQYNTGRSDFLKGLDKKDVFQTEYFREKYSDQAVKNISNEIKFLSKFLR